MAYVHGYTARETQRLCEQAEILEEILHPGTEYPPGAKVLEAGCGVGAQTRLLVKRNPGIELMSVDVSEKSLASAIGLKQQPGYENVTFQQENVNSLSFADDTFDHIFVCFVLEHLDEPVAALEELKRVLKPGGTVTCIEGDHGSCFWHPSTPESRQVWESLIAAQFDLGHDPDIGRRLTPLLTEAGFDIQNCHPGNLYADRLQPKLRHGMVKQIIVPMIQSAEEMIFRENIVPEEVYRKGIADISHVDDIDEGTFFYTWFKVLAKKG